MKIVVLNEAYISNDAVVDLNSHGFEIDLHRFTSTEDEMIARSKDADIIVIDMFVSKITEKFLQNCPNLKLICLNTTGFDLVDQDLLNKYNIQLANIPGFSTESVAELAISLMFALNRKILSSDRAFRLKPFQVDPGTAEAKLYLGNNIRGKTFGVYGLGAIGTQTAKMAKALGMKVIYYTKSSRNNEFEFVDRTTLFKESDFLSLHLALNDETQESIKYADFELMKPTAYLINVSRGKLILEIDLIRALENKIIAGAGLDTIVDYSKANPLLSLDNVILTPHIGWLTEESLINIGQTISENILSFKEAGSAKFRVN